MLSFLWNNKKYILYIIAVMLIFFLIFSLIKQNGIQQKRYTTLSDSLQMVITFYKEQAKNIKSETFYKSIFFTREVKGETIISRAETIFTGTVHLTEISYKHLKDSLISLRHHLKTLEGQKRRFLTKGFFVSLDNWAYKDFKRYDAGGFLNLDFNILSVELSVSFRRKFLLQVKKEF